MSLRSIFYRKAGETEWVRVVGRSQDLIVKNLPAEVKYEVDIGDGQIREVTTTYPAIGAPWSPEMFPLHLSAGFFDDDLPEGPVATWTPRGIRKRRPATQTASALRPTKAADGVVFAAESGQFLEMQAEEMAPALHRWCLTIFKMDTSSGERGDIVNINGLLRQPGIYVENGKLRSHWSAEVRDFGRDGTPGVATKRDVISDCTNLSVDGSTWNVALMRRRQGLTASSLNGLPHSSHTAPDTRVIFPRTEQEKTRIGSLPRVTNNFGMTVKCIIFGQGELTEKWEKKLEGWGAHHVGQSHLLPSDHPYRAAPPVIEAEDFEDFFVPDPARWAAHIEASKAFDKYQNRGGKALGLENYTRVFIDDFREHRLADSHYWRTDGKGLLFGPGWNPAVGGDHTNNQPQMMYLTKNPKTTGDSAPPVEYDPIRKLLKISLRFKSKNPKYQMAEPPEPWDPALDAASTGLYGRWTVAAFYTTDNAGGGRAWKNGYVARIRKKFDPLSDDAVSEAGRLWYGFWSYGVHTLEWWHQHRVEHDFIEPETENVYWGNLGSQHIHETADILSGADTFPSYKAVGTEMKTSKGWPFDIREWSGLWETWEIRVDPDFTYMNVWLDSPADPNDRSGMVEIWRTPTPYWALEVPMNVIVNTAARYMGGPSGIMPRRRTQKVDGDGNRLWLSADGSTLTTTDRGAANIAWEWANYRYWIDWIEVLQRNEVVYPEKPPKPFVTRPLLSRRGDTLIVDPKTEGVTHLEYLWHVDGYPVGGESAPEYSVGQEDAGKEVRVLVKAAGWKGRPEAWTDGLLV